MRRFVASAVLAALSWVVLSDCGGGQDGTVVPPALLTPSTSPTSPTSPSSSPSSSPTSAPTTSPSATPTATPTAPAVPGPQLVAWGRTDGLVSLVIRNTSAREIRSATVEISVFDRQHRLIRSTTGPARSTCCSVLRLPPGRPYGLFVNLGPQAPAVGSVTVRYASVVTGPWPRRTPTRIVAGHAWLERTRDDAIVHATLTARGPLRPFIVGQAILTGPGGHLRAVISGRFYCFRNGTTRELRMQLLHPVPPGTRIRRVLGYPIPPGQPTLVRGSCS
jgi:hypothetical protein